MKKEKIDIVGMTCSSCVAHVEKAVRKLDGIESVNVNLLSNNMVVKFDENKLERKDIENAVIDAGYGVNNSKKEIDDNISAMKWRLILSFVFLIPLMYISMNKSIDNLFASIFLAPIVLLNFSYYSNGFKRLFKGAPNMDSLIAIGSVASIVYGFFDSAGTILTLITLGKFLEAKSKGKTSEAITKLMNLIPQKAVVEKDGKEFEVDVSEICMDDIVVVKPGANIPVDGVIVFGESAIDESSITGESIPVDKSLNDKVISGTVNKNGFLKIKATKIGEDTTLSQIIKLVEEAGNSKAPISKIADKVSGIFVPVVILIAILTTAIWLLAGHPIEFAINFGIAVLVISCPCALGLAVPVAIMVGTGKGAEKGILIKSAESLEMLHKIDAVVLDKTGTITCGTPKVVDMVPFANYSNEEFLKVAASIEKNSEHPLASAIVQKANEENVELIDASEFNAISGRGIKVIIDGVQYFGGNLAFMHENKIDLKELDKKNEAFENDGKTVLYFAKSGKLIGIIVVADTIKPTSKDAISAMKKMNLKVAMLTGDNKAVANSIAKELGIDEVFSEVLPQDKERIIREFQEKGYKVAFVGDGINDSPALVRADVGFAIGQGTDIAIESADVVLIKNDLNDVVTALELGKAVMRKIKQNLFWAFIYNIIGIPVAAGVLYPLWQIKLSPMIGSAAMSFSSVSVVTNTLLLKRFRTKYVSEKVGEIISKDTSESYGVEISKDASENACTEIEEEKNEEVMVMKKVIKVEGMSCNHCKMSVEKVLKNFENVKSAEVNLEEKIAVIEFEGELSNDEIKNAIAEEGFEVVGIEE